MQRVYLDHNATTPLRAEARAAMVEAMDVVGNPSSVHAEGRAAKMMVERARDQVAALVGCEPPEIVFTSGATEAASQALYVGPSSSNGRGSFESAKIEHECVVGWTMHTLSTNQSGMVSIHENPECMALQAANSETGIIQSLVPDIGFCDMVQAVGKIDIRFRDIGARQACVSGHKLGGPKGVGALILRDAHDVRTMIQGGGQESGRRSGTENIIGIAGFGAAAEAARRDVDAGCWDKVAELRSILENAIAARSNKTIFVGNEVPRLPNTSCMMTPGWKGETQVMQMDLAGFAISAGSACSSGKVKASSVLQAMGFDETEASSAIRVSLGLDTKEDDVLRFADAWAAKYEKFEQRAA